MPRDHTAEPRGESPGSRGPPTGTARLRTPTDDSGPPSRSILRARRRRSGFDEWVAAMAVIDDVRPLGAELERSYTVYVRGRLKFRVGQIVYVAFSLDQTVMG